MAQIERGLTIERGRGATYVSNDFVVYSHSTYPRHSVLAGQHCRKWVASYPTIEEARNAHPNAVYIEGTTYAPPYLGHLPDGPDI